MQNISATTVLNAYDHRNRRIRKIVQRLHSTSAPPPAPPSGTDEWLTLETHTFVWDGNNIILEKVEFADGTTRTFEYFWSLDKSGTEQGAGGVGGLLAVSMDGVFYIPCYDNNGNITRYLNVNGNTVAQYTYDAFGNTISQSGSLADFFRHRFSTKYYDVETGLYYYGYRFYKPQIMRWLCRDLFFEYGDFDDPGIGNIYSFIMNNAAYDVDVLGQKSANAEIKKWIHVGQALEFHSWNCEEWKPEYGTTSKYLEHLKGITFRTQIHVPLDMIDDFAKAFTIALGMDGDASSYWCVTYAPLLVQKRVEGVGVKYRLRIYVYNFDKHPKCANGKDRKEIHQTQFEKKWVTYEL